MTRLSSLFAITGLALMASTTNALAIAGGPFDNGMPSAQLEEGGVYQANMKLKNGNGYCYFHPEQRIVPEDFTNATFYNARGSVQNRAVIYYKGVTYIGSAFGFTDTEANVIQCTINGSSEASYTQTTTQTQANFFNFSQSSVAVNSQIAASTRNFTVNGNWEGRFNKTAPTRRFTGKGELAFLSPTGSDAIANLALQSYANYINAINNFYSSSVLVGNVNILDFFLGGQQAISNALNAIPPFLAGAGIAAADANSIKERVYVRGVFRYL
jgi:hypothetical protein